MPKKASVNKSDQHRGFWEAIYKDCFQRLLAYGLKLENGRMFEAEELVQEAFCRGIRYRKNPEEINNPVAYLTTILRNIWLTKRRQEAGVYMESLDESEESRQKQLAVEPDVLRILENDEHREELRANQGPLTPLEKTLLELHLLKDYTAQEIADSLGEDVCRIRVKLNAVMAKVRSRMKRKR